MEERKILIANTKTQQRHELNTAATTLGELKQEILAQRIDFSGMTFTEGISKTQLLTDASLLPTNVMYKGAPTNNLVMLLTNTTKNIASGMVEVDERNRKNAYAVIKEMGQEAMDEIKDIYGKNYTQCKTDDLWSYIDENSEEFDIENEEDEEGQDFNPKVPEAPKAPKTAPHADLVEWIYLGIKAMLNNHTIFVEDVAVIADLTKELAERKKEEQPGFSDADIDDMIASI